MKITLLSVAMFCLLISSVSFAETTPDQLATEGKVMYAEGRYAAAVEVLEEAVAARPTFGLATYYLALSYIRTGETDQAVALLSTYLERVKQPNVQLTQLDKGYIPKNKELLTYAKTEIQDFKNNQ